MIVDLASRPDEVRAPNQLLGRRELPVIISAIALILTAIIANVWGNFPLNDDWVYAHSAKHFAETGVLQVNVPASQSHSISSAATLAGQTLLGGGLIRMAGFNHAYLRMMTMALAILMCWIINRILVIAGVTIAPRVFCLLMFVLNPISANLAFSFMTEYYGYVVALGGVLVWVSGRARAERENAPRLISLPSAVFAAVLIGGSFWIRQFCIAAMPALLIATALSARAERRERVLRSIVPVAASIIVFAGAVAAYFWWARESGNLLPQSGYQIATLKVFSPLAWGLMPLCSFAYATLFVLPALAAVEWKGITRRRRLLAVLGYGAVLTAALCAVNGAPAQIPDASLHRMFPYLKNILYNAGVGPRTTTDLFIQHVNSYPHWDARFWGVLEIVVVLGHLLWAALPSVVGLTRTAREICYFGAAFSAVSMAMIVQSSQMSVFDRYLFALLIGGTISVACLMPLARLVWWRGGIVLLVFILFTIGGVHDYFAANRARWDLVAAAKIQGIRAADIDGGWEVNGWSRFEFPFEKPSLPVTHMCAFQPTCLNDAFVIGMTRLEGYTVVESRRVDFWLAKGPDVLLSRRNDVPAITRAAEVRSAKAE